MARSSSAKTSLHTVLVEMRRTPDMRPLRLKGIRDVVSGLVVLTMMLIADTRLVGVALLVEAIVPLGDMSIILGSGGSKSRAFGIHGVTCAVMLAVGLLLIHAI
jgi:hypothetical protein